MSDFNEGSGQIRRPRVSETPSSATGVVAIVLALIAVVAGYLVLRSITGNEPTDQIAGGGAGVEQGGGGNGADDETSDTTAAPVNEESTSTTAAPGLVTDGASVIVANANGTGGSALKATLVLSSSARFQTVDPTDKAPGIDNIDTSLIYYDAGNPSAKTVAESLNAVLGANLPVAAIPETGAPVKGGDMRGAGVLLMLGVDLKSLTPGDLDLSLLNPNPAG